MRWSVSKSKMFQQCQRRWGFSDVIASATATRNPIRREVYLLKQLQSIYAWRGTVVDKAIDRVVIPSLLFDRKVPSADRVLRFAMDLADRQLVFSGALKHREQGMTKSKADDDYCALFDVEFNGGIDRGLVAQIKGEIQTAITNLIASDMLASLARNARKVIAQRNLQFRFGDFTVTCKPDVVAFFDDRPPMIIDWKVQRTGTTDHWLQLGIYAFGLSQVSPHRDFPDNFTRWSAKPHDYELVEYQLLQDRQKRYRFSEQDMVDLEDHITTTGLAMLECHNDPEKLDTSTYSTANFLGMCVTCPFKKMCWEEHNNEED